MSEESTLSMLPGYSPWPARLLGLEPWQPKKKVPSEIIREFDGEKWGPLWEYIAKSGSPIRIEDIEALNSSESKELMCWSEGKLQLMAAEEAVKEQFGLIASTLKELAPKSNAIVELGAGYGQIIVNLAKDLDFAGIPLIGAEYTESGVKIIAHLAESHGVQLKAAHCDLSSNPLIDIEVPEGAVLFTSYAAHYIPEHNEEFLQRLSALKPSLVVHFEPFFEHCDGGTLLGLLQMRYIQANDYNQNLLSVIKSGCDARKLEMVAEEKQIFGANALLPMSIVAWKPLI